MRLTSALFGVIGKWSKQYANLPDRYINRVLGRVPRHPEKPQFLVQKRKPYRPVFSLNRPWTPGGQLEYKDRHKHYIPVEPIKNWSFFRGDLVQIMTGKDKGKQGYVKHIYQERNWIIVKGLNLKMSRIPLPDDEDGLQMCIQEEQPLLVTTDVRLVEPADMQPTEVEWRYTAEGDHVRVSSRTGRIIPIPLTMEETIDYKSPELYVEKAKDTKAEDVLAKTFKPELKTFEMDIMEKMGIEEDRVPKKYYWY